MKQTFLFFKVALLAILFISCEEDKNDDTINDVMTFTIPATSYSEFVYFSFEEGGVVTIDDAATSTEWDLGFLRNHPRTNSGSSGPGTGGAYSAGKVDFSSVTIIDESLIEVDDTIQISDPNDPTHQTMMGTPGNRVLDGWGAFDFENFPPVFIPEDNIYIVKTANGNYAKIWFKSYYSVEGTSGNITMDYIYLSDGSKNFK